MKKILVVDDSETQRTLVKAALQPGEYTIVEAVNGNDGYTKAMVRKDLVLIIADYNMPGELNGLDMLEKIRSIEHHKRTPIFVVTTETSADLKKRGKFLGVTAWILKPFDQEVLRAAVDGTIKGNLKQNPKFKLD